MKDRPYDGLARICHCTVWERRGGAMRCKERPDPSAIVQVLGDDECESVGLASCADWPRGTVLRTPVRRRCWEAPGKATIFTHLHGPVERSISDAKASNDDVEMFRQMVLGRELNCLAGGVLFRGYARCHVRQWL